MRDDGDDLDELSKVVHKGFLGLTTDVYDWEDEDIARAVLKSAWLAKHDAATRTAALEEAAVIAKAEEERESHKASDRVEMRARDYLWPSAPRHIDYQLGRRISISDIIRAVLPSEPGTWWLDVDGYMWTVDAHGSLFRPGSMSPDPQNYSPFRQLVLKG